MPSPEIVNRKGAELWIGINVPKNTSRIVVFRTIYRLRAFAEIKQKGTIPAIPFAPFNVRLFEMEPVNRMIVTGRPPFSTSTAPCFRFR